ncbi:nitrile hydratase subunit beta [Phenylobacterium sp.]|uniref:nitrile hydratase subunit beta n=1 Tax=Phenylobacterium sp. TaxID=1871053 RepID=UPI0012073B2C|nr:nitrile hydratase subunit beta [Phenylobacterium sp.]THD59695.1 MAG: nitrile hydratase subunit beta [Phenylobacterium sp.]
MNGVHDMGGLENLGPIAPEPDEPVFHTAWEARVHALTVASPTRRNIDEGRHQRELIPGPQYLAMSYYEKWFTALCALLVKHGHATPHEIAAGKAAPDSPKAEPLLTAAVVAERMGRAGSYVREAAAPQFAVGDTVKTRQLNPHGHTRLPRYARGRQGVIVATHGAHVFPDSHAHGQGEDPRPLYTVRFPARELWGEAANPKDSVRLDLWEPYLERS